MYQHKIVFLLLISMAMTICAYSQQSPQDPGMQKVSGIVNSVDVQGGILNLNSDRGQMAFSVPDNAVITRETRPVKLGDVKQGDPVAIQYNTSSDAVYVVTSIIDSRPDNQ